MSRTARLLAFGPPSTSLSPRNIGSDKRLQVLLIYRSCSVRRLFCSLLVLFFFYSLAVPARAQETIREYTEGMEAQDGFLPLYWDGDEGRLLVEIPQPGREFLYLTSLATGVGSSSLGLDRGEIAGEYIARFKRVGPKAYLVLQNPQFRSTLEDEALARSVKESFPTSTVGAFDILAEEDGRLLVDMTAFFLRDAVDVRGQLRRAEQGTFTLDASRSTIYRPHTKAFPENTEVEAALTFTSDDPGWEVRRHTPDGRALTLREHHSFVQLPGPGYEPRPFDPRIGLFLVSFYDYARPLDEGYVTRYAIRHRLVKEDPDAAKSDPVEPIVYYLDPGVPEPYRTAFKEGARWFEGLFEAAGFTDAFRIEDMPPGMDPMDARYNVIQWVHRTEASSSIGPAFVDPRTGEIIKAAVRMDSHRSLVNYNRYMGLRPAFGDREPEVTAEEFAMARRRQHAAHEVGHTLGLAHNFIAASYGRASVMDYPAPLIKLEDGRLDLTDAYRPGPGAYDSLALRWAYTPFPEGQEEEGLEVIIDEAMARGLKFITNPDQGSAGSYPEASTWINGSAPLDELERVMAVRRFLIEHFDETALRPGEPMWKLRERFTPVYLHHRYILEAATKAVGGMAFRYALRGDPLPPTQIVAPERQRRALELLLDALEPEALAVPEHVLKMMAPDPFGYGAEERAFQSKAGPAVDQLGMARTLAEMVVGGLLHPERAARVAAFAARNPDLSTLEEITGRMIERTWGVPAEASAGGEHPALRRVVQRVVLDELIELAADEEATVEARAGAAWGLRRIAEIIEQREPATSTEAAYLQFAAAGIQRFLDRSASEVERSDPLPPPPGTPIGDPGRRQ